MPTLLAVRIAVGALYQEQRCAWDLRTQQPLPCERAIRGVLAEGPSRITGIPSTVLAKPPLIAPIVCR
jgi:hypothetical protein